MRIETGTPYLGSALFPGTERSVAAPAGFGPQDTAEISYSAMDDVPGTDQKISPYIILPPQDSDIKLTRELVQRELDKIGRGGNVLLKDDISVLNGVTASLDGRTRRQLEKLGYRLISDEPLKFILPHPNEQQRQTTHFDDDPVEEVQRAQTRPALTAPRYVDDLTSKYTGKGVTIAVLDTGIYPHPDLTYPINRITTFKDFVNGRSVPYDDNGHGTHIAGDAAGSGYMSEGLYRGPAPEASLVGVKVLNKNGGGRTSDILKGINWVIENRERYNIRVMNLSLGNRATTNPEDDPIYQAVTRAVDAGIVVVCAAGNDGPDKGSISTPGDNPKVITVGAVDDFNTPERGDDRIPDFSARGPALNGVHKPDLVAPGEAIIGPNAPITPTEEQAKKYDLINQTLQWLRGLDDNSLRHVPDDTLRLIGLTDDTISRIKTSPTLARLEIERLIQATERLPMVETSYVGSPGTSMAVPIVAGVVAQLLQANPNLTPDQVKEILTQTADPLPRYGINSQGAGVVDPHEAIEKAIEKAGGGIQQQFKI